MKNSRILKPELILIVIIFGLLSCRIFNNINPTTSTVAEVETTELTPTNSPSSTPTTLPTPLPTSEEKPATPTSIKIADFPPPPTVTQDIGVPPYDDFEDEEYDGMFDTSHFSLAFDSKPLCIVSQENGILRVQRVPDTNDFADCSLSVDKPVSVKSDRLENMYASFLHQSDHQGDLANSTLTYDARFDDILDFNKLIDI